jgi:anti-sigma regulatory factor (Ser/Thr protein kinase)
VELLCVDVPCDFTAPAVVRKAITQTDGLEAVVEDATLIASELVTNAVIHSGCASGDAIEVRVSRNSRRLVISVRDPGISGGRAEMVEGDRAGYGGYGLRVVDAVALRWGEERGKGYRVWAELPLADGDRSLTPS